MFKRISYIIVLFLITVNSAYSQKPQPFDREAVLQNHPELKKLSYSSRTQKKKLSPEVKQLLEGKGFKLLGQSHELDSPRKDTLSGDRELMRINVELDLKSSTYNPIFVYPKYDSNALKSNTDTIMTDDFEGDFPGTKWQRSGDPTWGKTDYKDHSGSNSIWCAKDGTRGVEPGNGYPDNSQSMIIYGPFDLSYVNYANLNFWYWLDIEYEKDWFFAMLSIDGNNFQGIGMSGESSFLGVTTWDEDMLHLNNLLGLGDVTGQSKVWIAFLFESDDNSSSDKGVFIDDVELTKRHVNGTPLAGIVSGELNTAGNPYIAVSDFGITEDNALEIKPGVEIRFEEGTELIVLGLLKAIGTPSDSILFTSAKTTPSPGDWGGVGLYDVASKNCRIQYCRIEYGGYGGLNAGAGGIYADTPEAEISNCVLHNNKNAGISCGNVIPGSTINNCKISNNENGIYGFLSSTFITNNIISENKKGVHGFLSSFVIKNNEIINNQEEGIYGNTAEPIIVSNIIMNNGSHGIYAGGGYGQISSGLTAKSNTIINNNGCGIIFKDFASYSDICQNIVANNKSNGIDFSEIILLYPDVIMYNNTIFQNNGFGIYYGNKTIFYSRILNNIIAGHPQSGIQFNPSQFFYIWHNDFFNNNPNINATVDSLGIISKTNTNGTSCDPFYNIFQEPSFKDASNLNYGLYPNSPCIDAGNPSVFYNDMNGTKNDMGAFGSSALYVYPTSYDFGEIFISRERETTVEIKNHRDVEFTINSLQLSDQSNYSVIPNSNLNIPSYREETLKVTFMPQTLGDFSSTLTLSSNGFYGANSSDITLNGRTINGTIINAIELSGTLDVSGSPYLAKYRIEVPEGESLKIEPGVKIMFDGDFDFRIMGDLLAEGTESDPIIFTRSHHGVKWLGLNFIVADSSSKLKYCIIEYSDIWGIYLYKSDITIKNSTIQYNRGNYDPFSSGGAGGIHLYHSAPIIINNIIRYNSTTKAGGGISAGNSIITYSKSQPIIEGNIIHDNWSDHNGGGILVLDSCIIRNNIVFNNHAERYGGGILSSSFKLPLIQNNIIYRNSSYDGGGIFGNGNMENNTIVNNQAKYKGGGLYLSGSSIISNSIVYSNTASENSEINLDNWANADIKYSDIKGGYQGEGNIDIDPLFIDFNNNNYHLQNNSPCIDKGNSDSIYNDPEDPNNPGYAMFPSLATVRNDMGAYGGPNAATWNIVTAVESKPEKLENLPNSLELFQNYPNPFNPTTTIKYQLPQSTEVSLKIYNLLGQLIKILIDEKQMAGNYSVIWDGENDNGQLVASGIYIYMIHTKNFVKVKKMVLIR